MAIDGHDNNLTKMIMGQEYDTESANMVFEEEDIDWSIMNIKMTIDKSGKQHPSWIYTPLYTRDSIAASQPLPVSAEQINGTEKTITITGEEETTVVEKTEVVIPAEVSVEVPAVEAEVAVDADVVDAAAAAAAEVEVEIPVTKVEYDTISLNEEFDVELGEWRCNEFFRLIFDPKGNIRPRIEFLVAQDSTDDVADVAPSTTEEEAEIASGKKEVVIAVGDVEAPADEPAESTEEDTTVVVVETTTVTVPEAEEETPPAPITDPVHEVSTQPDEMIGAVTVKIEPFPSANLPNGTTTGKTFVLPDINRFGKGIADFIKDELIDIHILQVLTINGGINWWADIKGCCKLFPLWTNESSLLSAINFAIFGFNNSFIPHLQSALYNLLGNDVINKSIKQRWSYNLWLKNSKEGLPIPTSADLDNIWQNTIQGSLFDYLGASIKGDDEVIPTTPVNIDPIHIYLLANLLRRPIIILTEVEGTNKNNISQSLKGIYIPFEQERENCHHSPIVLGYHLRHFTALVATDNRVSTLSNANPPIWVPISNAYLSLLPVHFTTYPGAEWKPYEVMDPLRIPEVSEEAVIDELVKYLQLCKVRFSKQTYNPPEDDVETTGKASDDDENKRYNYLTAVRTYLNRKPDLYKEKGNEYTKEAKKRYQRMKSKKILCKSNGCKNIPSSHLKGLCMRCYQRTLLNDVKIKSS